MDERRIGLRVRATVAEVLATDPVLIRARSVDMAQHTETPWRRTEDGYISSDGHGHVPIASPFRERYWNGKPEAIANAEFIVRACNGHDALLKALEQAKNALTWDGLGSGTLSDTARDAYTTACAAIALARGEPAARAGTEQGA